LRRALVVATAPQAALAARVAGLLGAATAGVFAEAAMHTPVEVTDRALDEFRRRNADGVVAAGGGSAVGLGKALSVRTGLPLLCLPTTYAGSEMTPILGETAGAEKRTRRDPRILPATVIYDPDLTATLPPGMAAASGMNALAHALEALYAPDCSPIVALMAEEAVAALAHALPRVVDSAAQDAAPRGEALYGAWLCGACLGQTTMGLHHKLCHVLGGSFGLPHAETHAVVLPHVAAFNEVAAPTAMARVAAALGAPTASAGLWQLGAALPLPRSLAELGLAEADLDR
ncbi:maleylacetate reductase, partial [Falsiroseomonas oryzae]|uniref:maleylacetate reductase n=1 Tax=Falsiroseomonas oryzae TaxID=2766473 RepID=UPI0022EB0E34